MSDEAPQNGAVEVRNEALRLAIDAFAEHAFLMLDPAGIVTLWNVGAERLFGYARERAVGRHWSMLLPPAERASEACLEVLLQTERQGSLCRQRWLTREDGTYRHVEATLVTLRGATGHLGYAAIAHEVPIPASAGESIRRLRGMPAAPVEDTSRQLSESQALLATEIADRTQAEAARMRLLRRLVVAQEEERRRIARDLHDDLGQRLTALRLALEGIRSESGEVPDPIVKPLQMLAAIDRELDFIAWELRPAALDELGLTKVLETYVHEWSQHAGICATFHTRCHDLARFAPDVEASVYRIAQEALNNVAKHAHARSVNVVLEQRENDIVLVIEDDGLGCRPISSSDTMIGLTGMRERAAAVGGTLEIEPTPGGGTTILTRLPLAPTSPLERSEAFVKADTAAAVSSAPDPGTASCDTDVRALSSIRKRLQELQQAVAARDEFIATVAHELRNPIAPLTFQLRLASDKLEQIAAAGEPVPVDWVQAQLRRIEQRLHRLLETLDRLLDVSHLSTGRIDLQREPVNLALVVREVVSSLDAQFAVARCRLMLVQRATPIGSWDRLRVEQICRNLLSNAIRFGAGHPIEVVVDADQDFASLHVRDHGPGIARERQAKIFERFETAMEQRSGGFGIGLWIVRNICLAMGGTVSVESDLGEGARFTVMLPRSHAQDSVSSKAEAT